MRIAAVQHDIVWEDRDATLAHVESLLAPVDADLIVLPELFAVGFTMNTELVAEAPDGPTTQWLVDVASSRGSVIGGSIPVVLDGADRPSNVFTLAAPDGTVQRYAKRHPFSFASEHEHYAPGNERLTVEVAGAHVSPFVCYDLRFADAFWPIADRTDVYLVVASWPRARRHHWQTLLWARAIENQAYVVGVNRVGSGGGLDYVGDSCIVDPMGTVLASATDIETVLSVDVDPALVAKVRAELPFMADRRED
jgi:predicted amidohydrolase